MLVSLIEFLTIKLFFVVIQSQAKIILVPRYKELGVRPVWALVKEIPKLLLYFPDFQENELPDRAYLRGVLWVLREDGWKQLISQARKARIAAEEEDKEELIEIHPDILHTLTSLPDVKKGTQKY